MKLLITLLIALLVIDLRAQELVKDLNSTPGGLGFPCYPCGNFVYTLVENELGLELWRTDGTSEGTTMVKDLYPGPVSGVFGELQCINDRIFIKGRESGFENRLFSSDGNEIIKEADVATRSFASFQNKIGLVTANQLWVKEATDVSLVKEFSYEDLGVSINEIYGASQHLYILLSVGDLAEIVRYELWKSDGTETGTIILKTFFADVDISGPPREFTEAGSLVYFTAYDEVLGRLLWKTDATPEGTVVVPDQFDEDPRILAHFDNKIIYTNRTNKTFVTDGQSGGNTEIFEGRSKIIRADQNVFYGIAENEGNDVLYVSDGTLSGTELLSILGPTNASALLRPSIGLLGGKIIVSAFTAEAGHELTNSLGGIDDLTLLKDIYLGSASSLPYSFVEYNDKIIFIANDGTHGAELWETDGTSEGTQLLKDTKTSTESASLSTLHNLGADRVAFRATAQSARGIWISDGLEESTYPLSGSNSMFILDSQDNEMLIVDGFNFFKSDGTDLNTIPIFEFTGEYFSFSFPSNTSTSIGSSLYFWFYNNVDGQELWKWNREIDEVSLLKDIYPGMFSSFYTTRTAVVNQELIFVADDGEHGREIWKTDGTMEGTSMITDILSPGTSDPLYLTTVGPQAFFRADDGTHGNELWKTDGTEEGTLLVKDIIPGEESSTPSTLARYGNNLIFKVDDGVHGEEPWISDGTTGGTHLLKDINSFGGSSSLLFYEFKGMMYFTADDGLHGIELWVTDGTEEGTRLIDLVPGEQSSSPFNFISNSQDLYFNAAGKLYRSTADQMIFEPIADFTPLGSFVMTDKYLLFRYRDPSVGEELFRFPIRPIESKQNQSINFQEISDRRFDDIPFEITANSSSGLPVYFSTSSKKIILSGNTVTIVSAGEVEIRAIQDGDDNYFSASANRSFCINPLKPVIDVDSANPSQPRLTSSSSEINIWYLNGVELTESSNSIDASTPGTYKLKVAVDDCESEFSEEYVFTITGLEGVSDGIRIFPVPARREININSEQTIKAVQILDFASRAFQNHVVESKEVKIDTSGLPDGVYFARIVFEDNVVYKKWIKK